MWTIVYLQRAEKASHLFKTSKEANVTCNRSAFPFFTVQSILGVKKASLSMEITFKGVLKMLSSTGEIFLQASPMLIFQRGIHTCICHRSHCQQSAEICVLFVHTHRYLKKRFQTSESIVRHAYTIKNDSPEGSVLSANTASKNA